MSFFTWKDDGLTSDCVSLDAMASRFEETAKLIKKLSEKLSLFSYLIINKEYKSRSKISVYRPERMNTSICPHCCVLQILKSLSYAAEGCHLPYNAHFSVTAQSCTKDPKPSVPYTAHFSVTSLKRM